MTPFISSKGGGIHDKVIEEDVHTAEGCWGAALGAASSLKIYYLVKKVQQNFLP